MRTDPPLSWSAASPAEVAEAKRDLRTRLRAQRAEASSRRSAREADELASAAPTLLGLARVSARDGGPLRIAAFDPTPREPDVHALLAALAEAGAELVLPLDGGDELDWAAWDARSALADSPARGFGREPRGPRLGPSALAGAALVLAPALAVDRSGMRLGHGRGLYDRALLHAPADVPVIAVVHPWEVLEHRRVPVEPHDRPVSGALTTGGLEGLPRP